MVMSHVIKIFGAEQYQTYNHILTCLYDIKFNTASNTTKGIDSTGPLFAKSISSKIIQ